MVTILLALVSLSGACLERVAVVAIAWKNVLLHFPPQNVLVNFGPSVAWKKVPILLECVAVVAVAWKNVPQNVLVHFGRS